MNGKEIKTGETYFFVGTDSKARKHLEGTEFTVFEIKHVWRRSGKKSRQVKRFFNEFGEGARAEELEPLASPDTTEMDLFREKIQGIANEVHEIVASAIGRKNEAMAVKMFEGGQRPESDYVDDPGTPF